MKKYSTVIVLFAVVIVLGTMCSVGIAFGIGWPIPFLSSQHLSNSWAEQDELMSNWNNVVIYTPKEDTSVETIVDNAVKKQDSTVEKQSDDKEIFYKTFSEIDKESLEQYLKSNQTLISNGYSKLLIDKADVNNTDTGIKTTQGDTVLSIDAYDNIIIVGSTVDGQKAKIAILKNKKQLGLSVVSDLSYWSQVSGHAKLEKAIFAVNASGYTWNDTGNYATLYGAAIRNGAVIRKYKNQSNLIGFNKDGDLHIGYGIDFSSVYNGCECGPALILNGKTTTLSDSNKSARTAIGQKSNGDIVIITVDGSTTVGATLTSLAGEFKKYEAVNAINLSGGNKSVMWWNGRIINNCYSSSTGGIKLPDAWVIRPVSD